MALRLRQGSDLPQVKEWVGRGTGEHKLKQPGSGVHALNHSAGPRVAKHSIWLGQPGASSASSVYRTFSLWRLTQMSSSCVILPYPNTSCTTSLNQLFDTLHSSFCPCLNPHLPNVDAVFQNWALLVPNWHKSKF